MSRVIQPGKSGRPVFAAACFASPKLKPGSDSYADGAVKLDNPKE